MIEAHGKRHFSKEKERYPFPISYGFLKNLCVLCVSVVSLINSYSDTSV